MAMRSWDRRWLGCILAATLVGGSAAAARATFAPGAGGVFTADVTMSVDEAFGGQPFAAVINPDADYSAIGADVPTNDSGMLYGAISAPTGFDFTNLPVYAIVDGGGQPWDPAVEPVSGGDLSLPLFSLQHVADLTLALVRQDLPGGGYTYGVSSGTYHSQISSMDLSMGGTVTFDLPPWGVPGWAWYGLNAASISLSEYPSAAHHLAISSNDGIWAGGWPGATLDKNFFPGPIPEPGTLALLALGTMTILCRGRRA